MTEAVFRVTGSKHVKERVSVSLPSDQWTDENCITAQSLEITAQSVGPVPQALLDILASQRAGADVSVTFVVDIVVQPN